MREFGLVGLVGLRMLVGAWDAWGPGELGCLVGLGCLWDLGVGMIEGLWILKGLNILDMYLMYLGDLKKFY